VMGITFKNPIGLAAGFDKNCQLMRVIPCIGFGFEEVGSITAEPYAGNPKPRLVRLPKDQSIIVYYGLKNEGARVLSHRLLDGKKAKKFPIPIGVSVAKTNKDFSSMEAKIWDWVAGIHLLKACGDYMTINVSCPNTFDPLNFNEPRLLDRLLKRAAKEIDFEKPVFLKLSADVPPSQIDGIVSVCDKYSRKSGMPLISGFILTNLVKDRGSVLLKSEKSEYAPYKGGLSGKPVAEKALALTRYAYENYGDKYIIISCGGIFTAEDAYERIRNGATLLQLITGMIYGGPAVIKRINRGIVRLLERDGYAYVAEAVGSDCAPRWKGGQAFLQGVRSMRQELKKKPACQ